MKRGDWIGGNSLRVLENGEEYFPAVFAAIEAARREVLVETFILFEDKVGLALHAVLLAAAKRGVRVDLTVDGFGSPALSTGFVGALTEAGVRLHVFDPPPRLSRRLQPFRRLHRKIVVVDGEVGFIGGMNFSADHLADYGPEAKHDFAVVARGPIVEQLRRESRRLISRHSAPDAAPNFAPNPQEDASVDDVVPAIEGASTNPPPAPPRHWWQRRARPQNAVARAPGAAGSAECQVVIRDNDRHRDDIERHYRRALHAAKREVIIANAYFFPGYRLIRSLQRAAKRGVKVHLLLQGTAADVAMATFAARMVYGHLIDAGVCVHELCERPMHGKVALVDDEWATVGSSNLDPLSLSLNLEANLMIRDRAFNAKLREKLMPLLHHQCQQVQMEQTTAKRWWWRLGVGYLVFHAIRHFPRWVNWLPAHRPRLVPAAESTVLVASAPTTSAQAWAWQSHATAATPGRCR